MLRNFSLEERFDPSGPDEDLVSPVQRVPPSFWPLATVLRTVASALRDGLLAARQYEHLRSRGLAHDLALRMAIGVRHARSDIRPTARRHRSGPLACRPHSGEAAALRRQDLFPEQVAPSRSSARIANLAYAHGA